MQVIRFAGAVGVNVLANLIAAGIVYLFGQWFGSFPSRPVAIFAAVIFVVLALQFLGLGLTIYFRHEGRALLAEAISAAISAVMVLVILFWARYDDETAWRIAFSALVLVSGAGFFASALALGKAWRASRTGRSADEPPYAPPEVLRRPGAGRPRRGSPPRGQPCSTGPARRSSSRARRGRRRIMITELGQFSSGSTSLQVASLIPSLCRDNWAYRGIRRTSHPPPGRSSP